MMIAYLAVMSSDAFHNLLGNRIALTEPSVWIKTFYWHRGLAVG